jgi:hypothetical protein
MTVVIRRANVRDWEAIRRFIFEAYGKLAPYKDYARWNWQFVANPFRSSLSDEISVWIAEDEGRVVGQIAVQAAPIQIDRSEFCGGWIVDVMVLPAYRGQLLGHQLHAAVASEFPLLVTLTMAPAMRRIALRAGCLTLNSVQQYTKIIHLSGDTVRRYLLGRTAHRPLFRRLVQVACTVFQLDRLGTMLVNASLYINLDRFFNTNRLTSAKHTALEIVEVEFFDCELDGFWDQVRHEYPAISIRNARFLNWRYVSAPDLHYRRFIARKEDQCIGYIVIRHTSAVELPAGVIVDFLTFRNDLEALRCLIGHAAGIFGDEVDFLDCATSVPAIGTILEKFGFFRTRTEHPTIVCRDPLLRSPIQGLQTEWFFTKGDQDWDQIFIS